MHMCDFHWKWLGYAPWVAVFDRVLHIKAALNVAYTPHHFQMGPCQACAWVSEVVRGRRGPHKPMICWWALNENVRAMQNVPHPTTERIKSAVCCTRTGVRDGIERPWISAAALSCRTVLTSLLSFTSNSSSPPTTAIWMASSASSSSRKKRSNELSAATAWSEWKWDDRHGCWNRYRLDNIGKLMLHGE